MSALAEKQHVASKVAARKSGAAVTCTLGTGSYDGAAGTWSGVSTSTVTGVASRVSGDPKQYEGLGLVESEAPTLSFTPDTYGETPALNSSLSFGSTTFIVRRVFPWAPDGNTISCRMIVSR